MHPMTDILAAWRNPGSVAPPSPSPRFSVPVPHPGMNAKAAAVYAGAVVASLEVLATGIRKTVEAYPIGASALDKVGKKYEDRPIIYAQNEEDVP